MKLAYAATILDLSLPLEDDAAAVARVAEGLVAALEAVAENPSHRVEVALAGAVTRAFLRFGHERPLQMLAERAMAGQLFFNSTACYGAFLPLLPYSEACRQIDLSEQINRDALGEWVYRPDGFFPTQLGYNRRMSDLAVGRGLRRIIVDSLGYKGGAKPLPRTTHFRLYDQRPLDVLFVDRPMSERIEFGVTPTAADVRKLLDHKHSCYVVVRIPARLLVDGAPGVPYLRSFATQDTLVPASLEDVTTVYPTWEEVEPLASALGTTPDEVAAGVPYAKWFAPGNELHAMLWRMTQLLAEEACRKDGADTASRQAMRQAFDEALDSSPWRYASGRPEYDPSLVLRGATRLMVALRAGGLEASPNVRRECEELYARIEQRCGQLVETGLQLQAAHGLDQPQPTA